MCLFHSALQSVEITKNLLLRAKSKNFVKATYWVINSSHRRGSGPKAQTRGVDSFKKNTCKNSI